MNFHIEIEREDDGRWIAEVPEIPGVLAYGVSANRLAPHFGESWLERYGFCIP